MNCFCRWKSVNHELLEIIWDKQCWSYSESRALKELSIYSGTWMQVLRKIFHPHWKEHLHSPRYLFECWWTNFYIYILGIPEGIFTFMQMFRNSNHYFIRYLGNKGDVYISKYVGKMEIIIAFNIFNTLKTLFTFIIIYCEPMR